jgi:hypothetical protein
MQAMPSKTDQTKTSNLSLRPPKVDLPDAIFHPAAEGSKRNLPAHHGAKTTTTCEGDSRALEKIDCCARVVCSTWMTGFVSGYLEGTDVSSRSHDVVSALAHHSPSAISLGEACELSLPFPPTAD